MKLNRPSLYAFLLLTLSLACCKDPVPEPGIGKVSFTFFHEVNGSPLVFDSLKYVNAAGNHYMVNDIQYFVSKVTLYKNGGMPHVIEDQKFAHYVDTYLPGTFTWDVADDLVEGTYDSISFILGLDEEMNKTGYFVNPPEVDMFWPDIMGGGYHFMKLNGKWLNLSGFEYPYNYHLGLGMEVSGSDTVFFQNYVKVSLPSSSFSVNQNGTTKIAIKMNIDSWFRTPHVWNHDSIGGAIMMNQSAMNWAKENGHDVFSMSILP